MMPRLAIGLTTLAVAAMLLFAATYKRAKDALPQAGSSLPRMGALPSVPLTTEKAEPWSNSPANRSMVVAHLIFTRCPTVCPVVVLKMKALEEKTRGLGFDLGFASISVDPSYDTPETLAAFAGKFGVSTKRWSFLTGVQKDIDAIVASLKLSLENRGPDSNGIPDIIHGVHFVLLDRDRQIRGYYDSDEAERMDALLRDIETLSQEPAAASQP